MADEKPKGKKAKKKKTKIKKGEHYKVQGNQIERLKTPCPKCGPGVFMAQHKNRLHCGKCGYTMMKGSKPEAPAEPKEEPKETPGETEETPKQEKKE
jgi:small subunit ribosomal protein S27Ae